VGGVGAAEAQAGDRLRVAAREAKRSGALACGVEETRGALRVGRVRLLPEVYYLFGICQYLGHVFTLWVFRLLLDLVEDGFNQLLPFGAAELLGQQLCCSGIRIWR
jgi:hypothetical protein